jgi:predicted Zn-dependent protease
MLASARVALGRWREAEAAVRALEPLDGPRARALRAAILVGRNRVGEGAALLGRAGGMPEAAPEPGALTAVVSGYLGAGEAGAAEAFLAELLAGDPENLQALGLMGLVHAAAGRAGAAREAQARVLALDPDNAAAIAELARLDAAEGDLAGARARLEAGLGRIPGHPLLMLRLARLRAAAGDAEGALALLERLHARAPDSPGIANDLASLLAETRADDPEAIERAYAIAGRLRDSPEPAHQDTYAWTRHLRGEHREARARLERVVEAVPDNPWPRYHLGMVLLALGEEAAAREALEAALARADGRPFPPAPRIREALAARAPG